MQEHNYSDNGRQYMVLGEEEGDESSGYEMRMLIKNRLESFLPVKESFTNGIVAYEYEITGFTSLEEYGRRRGLGVKEIGALLAGIEKLRDEVAEYMLDVSQVIMNSRFIYINGDTVKFTYYAEKGKDFFVQLKSLWEEVLAVLDHSDKKLVMKAYGVYQDILTGTFEPHKYDKVQEEPKTVVEYANETIAKEEVWQEVEVENTKLKEKVRLIGAIGAGVAIYGVVACVLKNADFLGLGAGVLLVLVALGICASVAAYIILQGKVKAIPLVKMEQQQKLIDYKVSEEELKPKQDNATKLLSLQAIGNSTVCRFRLTNKTTGQQLEIPKFPAILGTMPNCNVILQGDGISRVHAVINREDNELYVEDMGSTNGTWVNDSRIEAHSKALIKSGDTLKMAVWEFELNGEF